MADLQAVGKGGVDFVTTRRIGDAIVSIISEGTTLARLGDLLDVSAADVCAALPAAMPAGEVELAFTVTHVRLGAASVLIDGGMGPPSAKARARRTAGIEAGLAHIGERPDDLTHLLLTHAHWDHVDGALVERDGRPVPRFPSARHLIGRLDWEVARAGTHPHSLCLAELTALHDAGVLDFVDGDREIAPGITMVDAPGETPGHHVVLVESRGESFVHLADLYHHPVELARDWVQERTDRPTVLRTRARILGNALRRPAVVVAAHALLPGWARVVATASGYGVEPIQA
jgi:glyoxylase-like metal-dependent hydrolase (beta-lactamase superfamily II)